MNWTKIAGFLYCLEPLTSVYFIVDKHSEGIKMVPFYPLILTIPQYSPILDSAYTWQDKKWPEIKQPWILLINLSNHNTMLMRKLAHLFSKIL